MPSPTRRSSARTPKPSRRRSPESSLALPATARKRRIVTKRVRGPQERVAATTVTAALIASQETTEGGVRTGYKALRGTVVASAPEDNPPHYREPEPFTYLAQWSLRDLKAKEPL